MCQKIYNRSLIEDFSPVSCIFCNEVIQNDRSTFNKIYQNDSYICVWREKERIFEVMYRCSIFSILSDYIFLFIYLHLIYNFSIFFCFQIHQKLITEESAL